MPKTKKDEKGLKKKYENTTIHLSIKKEIADKLSELAKKENRNRNNYIINIIIRHINEN